MKVSLDEKGFVPRTDGEWFTVGDEHFITCCACGLTHYCEFRVKDGVIQMRAEIREDLNGKSAEQDAVDALLEARKK